MKFAQSSIKGILLYKNASMRQMIYFSHPSVCTVYQQGNESKCCSAQILKRRLYKSGLWLVHFLLLTCACCSHDWKKQKKTSSLLYSLLAVKSGSVEHFSLRTLTCDSPAPWPHIFVLCGRVFSPPHCLHVFHALFSPHLFHFPLLFTLPFPHLSCLFGVLFPVFALTCTLAWIQGVC